MSCQVQDCRHSDSHVTKGHRCGRCKGYGHGQVECGNRNDVDALKEHFDDLIATAQQCTVQFCEFKKLHKTAAHMCGVCKGIHTEEECKLISTIKTEIKCPICRVDNTEYKKVFGISQT